MNVPGQSGNHPSSRRPARNEPGPPQKEEAVQTKISARHGHLHETTQDFIRAKAEKLLHFFDRLTLIEVTVDQQKELKDVKFVIQAEHKHDIVAHAQHKELLAAVDLVMDKLEAELRR